VGAQPLYPESVYDVPTRYREVVLTVSKLKALSRNVTLVTLTTRVTYGDNIEARMGFADSPVAA